MRHDRLQHLVEILQRITDESTFDMRAWSCESAACAVGHACMDPLFNQEGLYFAIDISGDAPRYFPRYGRLSVFPAVREFFGLSIEDAHHLFHSLSYNLGGGREVRPKHVIARIEDVMRRDIESRAT